MEVEYTDQFGAWWHGLTTAEQNVERGPGLGRRHPNMKELRIGTIRVLFAFDPRRAAILLIGGDKRDRWQEFYEQMVPVADDLYDQHLQEVRQEGSSDA